MTERPAADQEDAAPDPDGSGGSEGTEGPDGSGGPPPESRRARQRKQVLLRLDPAVHDALARWAAAELRSTNAQIDFLLRRALAEQGRLPKGARPHPRRGRPPRDTDEPPD